MNCFSKSFKKYGYGTLGKNDLQDLMIYCLNRASEQDFLNDCTNYDIARIFKTTDSVAEVRLDCNK